MYMRNVSNERNGCTANPHIMAEQQSYTSNRHRRTVPSHREPSQRDNTAKSRTATAEQYGSIAKPSKPQRNNTTAPRTVTAKQYRHTANRHSRAVRPDVTYHTQREPPQPKITHMATHHSRTTRVLKSLYTSRTVTAEQYGQNTRLERNTKATSRTATAEQYRYIVNRHSHGETTRLHHEPSRSHRNGYTSNRYSGAILEGRPGTERRPGGSPSAPRCPR